MCDVIISFGRLGDGLFSFRWSLFFPPIELGVMTLLLILPFLFSQTIFFPLPVVRA